MKTYANLTGRGAGNSVPNLIAQNMAPGKVRALAGHVARDIALPPTEIELLRGEIATMREEASEAETRILKLEALLEENGIEVP